MRHPPALPVIVPVALAVAALVAQGASGPVLFSDELGYLGTAVELSTRDAAPALDEIEFYSPGYGLVLAPLLSVLPFDPWTVAVGLNLVCAAAIGPVLWLLLRDTIGASVRATTVGATAGASVPAVVLQVPRAWPELLFTLVTVVWALALARFLDRARPAYGLTVVVLSVVAFVVHRRAVVLIVVAVAAVVGSHVVRAARADRERRPVEVAWAGGAVVLLAVGLLANRLLDGFVKDRLYGGGDLVDATDRVVELAGEDLAPRLVAGVWSAAHATFGLGVVAVVVLAVLARSGPSRAWAAAVLLAFAGSVLLSVVVVADGPRVDHLLYERYVAPMFVIVVGVAVARTSDRPWSFRAAAAAVAVLPLSTVVLVVAADEGAFDGAVQKLTVPTLSALELVRRGAGRVFLPGLSPWWITAAVVVAAAALLAALRWRADVGAAAVLGLFASVVLAGSYWSLRPFLDHWEPYGEPLARAVRERGLDDEPLVYAPSTPEGVRTVVHHRLEHPPLQRLDADACPPVAYLLAERDFAPAYAVERVVVDPSTEAAIFVPRC